MKKHLIEESIVNSDQETISPTIRHRFLKDWSVLVLNAPQPKQHVHYYWDKNNQIQARLKDERSGRHFPFFESFNDLTLKMLGVKNRY